MTTTKTKIITNHHWRPFVCRWDVPADVLADQFDYQDGGLGDGFFFHYRGVWYHLDMFMSGGVEGWHAAHGDSFFSGVVVRISDDGEEYQVGTYYTVAAP